MKSTRQWLVRGKVQGVGFRYFARREAEFLGLTGNVRNLENGQVQVTAHGENDALEAFFKRLTKGPSAGRVDLLEEVDSPDGDTPSNEFRIVF